MNPCSHIETFQDMQEFIARITIEFEAGQLTRQQFFDLMGCYTARVKQLTIRETLKTHMN